MNPDSDHFDGFQYRCLFYLEFQNTYNTMEPFYSRHFGTRYFRPFLLQYRGFPLSEIENVLVTPFGTNIVLIMEVFSIVSLIQRVY